MNCDSYRNTENNGAIRTCFGSSRDCAVYSFVLTFSTFILITSMFLTIYLTHIDNYHRAIVVLIVSTCLLYILMFLSVIYNVYFCLPEKVPSGNGENPNRAANRTTRTPAQSPSTRGPPSLIIGSSRSREPFRTTPPPPYEVRMSEMSRMLFPDASRTTEPSTKESEIIEEARNLVRRMYEEIKMNNQQQVLQPRNEASVQQMMQRPKTPVRQQEMMFPKVSHPNQVVATQQTAAKSMAGRGLSSFDIHGNQAIPQKVARNSVPNHLYSERLVTNSEGCTGATPKSSPRREHLLHVSRKRKKFKPPNELQMKSIAKGQATYVVVDDNDDENNKYEEIDAVTSIPGRGLPSDDFHTNQASQREVAPNSLQTHLALERFIIDNEGCFAAYPQPSPGKEDFLRVAHTKKLISTPKKPQTSPNTRGISTSMVDNNGSVGYNYDQIDATYINSQNMDSSQEVCDTVQYYCIEKDFEDASKQGLLVRSAVSEPDLVKQKRNPTVKVRRRLSASSTRKFLHLKQSPETFLDAIGTCFDLTPDEWMVAWKLCNKGVPPAERARILGIHLHEDSYSDGN